MILNQEIFLFYSQNNSHGDKILYEVSVCIPVCRVQGLHIAMLGPGHLECLLVLLDLNHDVVDVDEFTAYGQSLVWVLRQDLLETVVVLDELAQGKL